MKINEDRQLIITKDDGTQTIMEILFTYEHPDNEKTYVLYFDPANDEEVLASRYDDEGNLYDVDGEEYEHLSAILENFLEEQEEPEPEEEEKED